MNEVAGYILLSGGALVAAYQIFQWFAARKANQPQSVAVEVDPADFIGSIAKLISQTELEDCKDHLRKAGQSYVANLGTKKA
jgi:hypothetical protein